MVADRQKNAIDTCRNRKANGSPSFSKFYCGGMASTFIVPTMFPIRFQKTEWFGKVCGRRMNFAVAVLLLAVVCGSGCIRRRMTFRTNPAGAMVYVDKQPIGLTPVSTSFTYYGTRNIEIVRDGYRTEKFLRKMNPPWYAIPPLDFFTETLYPFEKRDERIIDVQMTPDPVVPTEALIASGEQLRLQASQGVAVSPPPTMNVPTQILPGNPGLVPQGNVPILAPADPNGIPLNGFPSGPVASPYPGQPVPAPAWQPGDYIRDIFTPGGQAPLSNPATTVVPGGGYRPPQP